MKQVLLKSLLTSHPLTLYWAKQVTWSSPPWVGWRCTSCLFQGQGVQSHMAKDMDVDVVVEVVKSWKE